MTMSFRIKSPSLHRCDLCHQPSHNFYRVKLGEDNYIFCSGAHAQVAAKNYSDKLKNGVTPTPVPDAQLGEETEPTYE